MTQLQVGVAELIMTDAGEIKVVPEPAGTGDWPLGAALSILMLLAFVVCYGLTVLGLRLFRLDRIRFVSRPTRASAARHTRNHARGPSSSSSCRW